MKNVLITGAGSYIGMAAADHLSGPKAAFAVDTLDVRGEAWEAADFSIFDAVLHVAGIAHQKESPEKEALYSQVNHRLAVEVAKKAKEAGVKQFVFLSTMSVYGMVCGHITAETQPAPTSLYGASKWQAEKELCKLTGDGFQMAILRPPMIYGAGCRGNYPRLSAMARRLPLFPKCGNKRSMLYIGFLCSFLEKLIESGQGGLFFPQNPDYVSTDEMVRQIALAHQRRIWQPRGFGWLLRHLAPRISVVGKVFGSLTYAMDMSIAFREDEPSMSFADTIRAAEGKA